jgi:hypothetical protein
MTQESLEVELPKDARPRIEEMVGSLNGWDEIAIEQKFGKGLADLSATLTARACAFVLKRREGMNDLDAFRAVMDMTILAVNNMFETESEGVDEGNS